MGVNGRMWRVINKMYESSKSAVLLEGEKSDTFTIEQGVAQGCSLSPYYFQYSLRFVKRSRTDWTWDTVK